jgi:preprotein translocase subunit SecF
MFDFVGKKRWFLLASAIIIFAGIISLAVPGGLKPGIDFEGGISITLGPKEGETLALEEVETTLSDLGHEESRVQVLGEGDFFIRTRQLGETDEEQVEEQEKLRSGLEEIGEIREFGSISAVVASETVRNAAIAVAVAALAVLLYITWAFRKMPSPFRYGTCAIVALLHDVLIVLTVFSFLGRILGWEIDPVFVTAVLAVIGYSVNDTIVVFDRIREAKGRANAPDFPTVVNLSLTGTLGRSLNTSLTTIMAVLAIYLFVGGTIRNFTLALLIGTIAGTYSSIFIASQLLVIWEKRDWRRGLAKVPILRKLAAAQA